MQNVCSNCGNLMDYSPYIIVKYNRNDYLCKTCFKHHMESMDVSIWMEEKAENNPFKSIIEKQFNEPEHYHKHEIDTIEFLKRGFPPQVYTGFLIGNIIKYTQRFEYKNGEEDLKKVVDYAKRLQEWYKETHS